MPTAGCAPFTGKFADTATTLKCMQSTQAMHNVTVLYVMLAVSVCRWPLAHLPSDSGR